MKQKVNLFIELADPVPNGDNRFDTTKIYHWRVYVDKISDSSYWLVCAHDPQEAVDRFLSFSNYEVNDLYILT